VPPSLAPSTAEVVVVKKFERGLRCQDVHAGLRTVDSNSALLAQLEDTRVVGMAASLAATIRGQDVIQDAQLLKVVAADQIDIDHFAYNDVIEVLEGAELVHSVIRDGKKITSFQESIPFHQDLYSRLGAAWRERKPTQFEDEFVTTVHHLASGPIPGDELVKRVGIDKGSCRDIIDLGKRCELIKSIDTKNGSILYSPFMGFEHPDVLVEVVAKYGSERLQEELDQVRCYQGLPVNEKKHPVLADAITRGFISAPSVQRPDKAAQSFACLPYTINRDFLTVKKTVLDKALAVLACVRCGQHFGGATGITAPIRLLTKLCDKSSGYSIGAHSSARRQYQLLFRMQVVDFEPSGDWARPRLIATDDNLAAVRLAIELLTYGEPMIDRVGVEGTARAYLDQDSARYLNPLATVQERRNRILLTGEQFEPLMHALMGRVAL